MQLSDVAYRIQYIPGVETPQEDPGFLPATPSSLSVTGNIGAITLRTSVTLLAGDLVEFYASIDNNRTNAVRVGFGAIAEFVHTLPVGEMRWYWVRVRRVLPAEDLFGSWFPSSATGGIVGQASTVDTQDIEPGAVTGLYAAADTGPDTFTSVTTPGSPNYYLRVDGAALASSNEVVRVTLTTQMKVSTGGQIAQAWMLLDWGPSNQQSQILDCYDTLEQGFAVQAEFTPTAGNAWVLTTRISTNGTATWHNTRMQVEVIRR